MTLRQPGEYLRPTEIIPGPGDVLIPIHGRGGPYAIVERGDAARVLERRWYQVQRYAIAHLYLEDGIRHGVPMHRFIMDVGLGDPRWVQHRNGNGLDNRRANLRVCTVAEAQQNKSRRSREHLNASGLRGVRRSGRGWSATVELRGVCHHLGTHPTERAAAAAAARFRTKHMPYSEMDQGLRGRD